VQLPASSPAHGGDSGQSRASMGAWPVAFDAGTVSNATEAPRTEAPRTLRGVKPAGLQPGKR